MNTLEVLVRGVSATLFPLVVIALSAIASAQDYPSKPIRIVTAAAGGTGDFTTRTLAKALADNTGWTIVVDNRQGGLYAIEAAAKAPSDGYTLLVDSLSFVVGPLAQRINYDMAVDFSPVALLSSSPTLLVVHPSLGVKTVKDCIALARARPGELNYSSTGIGGVAHLTAELFKSMARVNIVHVPYKATSQALTDVIGGQVQLMFAPTGPAVPHVKSGRLRALAVTSARQLPLLPELPTVAATLPGYESTSLVGLFGPAKTPAALVSRLNQEIVRALQKDELRERLAGAGVEPGGGSPAEFTDRIASETTKWNRVVRDAGIKPD